MPSENPKKGFGRTPDRSSAAAPTGKSWFFGIGTNEYQHFPRLNNARKDITSPAISHVLPTRRSVRCAWADTGILARGR